MSENRRKFIKTIGVGTLGALATPVKLWSKASTQLQSALTDLKINDNSESYWEKVQSQFHFVEGLTYFNNGSLGACPKPIREATNNFRNTLDDFPSKYMWGGWKNEIEEVRKKTAELLSVSSEEIALIHNTTEGMNLIASSMNLKPGDEIISADHEHKSALIRRSLSKSHNS